MKADILSYLDKTSITVEELVAAIPSFPTKKAALEAGKNYGWSESIKLVRRFETIWMVGKKDFANESLGDITVEIFRFPMLKWVGSEQPVIQVKRFLSPKGPSLKTV